MSLRRPLELSIGTQRRCIPTWMLIGTLRFLILWEPLFGLHPIPRTALQAEYRIETIAGCGKPGDIPDAGGHAREVPIDLPFGVENGPGGALFVTTVGSHRVLRLDRRTGRLTLVAGTGRPGYSGDGGPATEAALKEPYEVRFDSQGNMLIVEMQNRWARWPCGRTRPRRHVPKGSALKPDPDTEGCGLC